MLRAETSLATMTSMTADDGEPRVFRVGGISYLRIPAESPSIAAAFYQVVFGWILRGDADDPSFEDGTGHVIGHFMADMPVAGEAGIRPYIYVEGIDGSLNAIAAHGGEVVTAPHPEGDLWVAVTAIPQETCSACGSAARARNPT